MKFQILLGLLLISTVYSKVEWETGKDTTLQWSGNCKHALQCGNELGRYVDVTVSFVNKFSTAPQVGLSFNALDFSAGLPAALDLSLQSVTTEGFTYRVTAYTEKWIGTVHVNWFAVLDSKIRIQYVHQHQTPGLSNTNTERTGVVSTSYVTNYDRPLECERPAASAFILGGEVSSGSQEFSVYVLDNSNPSYAEIDISAADGYLEWISFMVVAGCQDNMEPFFVGAQVQGQGTNWTTGSGKRFQSFSHDLNKPDLIEQGGFVFSGISTIDAPGDVHNMRVNAVDQTIENGTYSVNMGTWSGTVLEGLFYDVFTFLPQNQCALLYSECDFEGVELQVCSGEPINSFAARDWADKEVKSVKVPYGRTLSLFDARNLEGPYTQVKGEVACSTGWTFT